MDEDKIKQKLTPREKAAKNELEAAEAKKKSLQARLARLKQQDSLVQSYMRSMLTAPAAVTPGSAAGILGPPAGTNLDKVTELLSFHLKQCTQNDEEQAALIKQIEEAKKTQEVLEART